MKGPSPIHRRARKTNAIAKPSTTSPEQFADEVIMHLERDQFVAETSRPVPRVVLGRRVAAGLWVLRVFVVLVSVMVIYTFVDQLH
jgi:hypothetical protein